ncbi:MAG: peptide deformylase [Candidatus Margulisiibacteriota bacterium]
MARKILKFPNPKLRLKAKPVKKLTPAIVKLIDEMTLIMHLAPGVGLAAPQVGKSLRVIVVDVGPGPIALVNPELLKKSGHQIFTEGCLSLPGVEAPVERAAEVEVRGLDRDGQEIVVTAEGLLATVFQHEIDHLDGFVFIDRVKNPATIKYVPRRNEKKEELI